ncbi:protein phosphatase 2C-like domain-containing protein 1 [Amia ocellicauda]|uniref:protein phosphatase 2C-like domain-containing protein 1 n=1 Tax=Amia ocellicauda TaxID=2972642 RepID=UPI003464115D
MKQSLPQHQDIRGQLDEDHVKVCNSNKIKEENLQGMEDHLELHFLAHAISQTNINGKQECTSDQYNHTTRNKHKIGNSVTIASACNPLIKGVGFCEDKNAAWKLDMEDASIFIDQYGGRHDSCFIGLFDGFHGRCAAEVTSKELPILVLEQLSKRELSYSLPTEDLKLLANFNTIFEKDCKENPDQNPSMPHLQVDNIGDDERVHMALAEAFLKMDRILGLGRHETSKIRWSGCTALICLIESPMQQKNTTEECRIESGTNGDLPPPQDQERTVGKLHVANCGNTQAVLCKNGKGHRLTKDHSTSNRKERRRVLEAGATISGNRQHGLVEGLTRATRALGNHGDPKLKQSVIPVPYSVSLPMDDSFQLLVLASSGVWDVLDENAVAAIALDVLSSHLEPPPTQTQDRGNTDASNWARLSDTLSQPRVSSQEQTTNSSECVAKGRVSQSGTVGGQEEIQEGSVNEKPLISATADSEGRLDAEQYERLAACISRKIVEAAVTLGSRENISVATVLLPGLDLFFAQNVHQQ